MRVGCRYSRPDGEYGASCRPRRVCEAKGSIVLLGEDDQTDCRGIDGMVRSTRPPKRSVPCMVHIAESSTSNAKSFDLLGGAFRLYVGLLSRSSGAPKRFLASRYKCIIER